MSVSVFFSDKVRTKGGGLRSWLLRRLIRGRFGHVAIRMRDQVRNVQPTTAFCYWVEEFRGLGFLEIEIDAPFDWELHELGDDAVIDNRAVLKRWITRGRSGANDCVSDACRVLRLCGLRVPCTIITPQDLHDWMLENGGRIVGTCT